MKKTHFYPKQLIEEQKKIVRSVLAVCSSPYENIIKRYTVQFVAKSVISHFNDEII